VASIDFAPGSAISIFPDRLLDDAEECILVGLIV
jgi:hypothetical protein